MSRQLSVTVDEEQRVHIAMPIEQARLLYEQVGELPQQQILDKHMVRSVYKQLGALMLISQPDGYFRESG